MSQTLQQEINQARRRFREVIDEHLTESELGLLVLVPDADIYSDVEVSYAMKPEKRHAEEITPA